MTTDPPCARCAHAAVCHETNYVERGPCWKCHTCPGYVMKFLPGPPLALPPRETCPTCGARNGDGDLRRVDPPACITCGTHLEPKLIAEPPPARYSAHDAGRPFPDEIPGHLHREIETWTDDCGCTWANTSTRTHACAGHAVPPPKVQVRLTITENCGCQWRDGAWITACAGHGK